MMKLLFRLFVLVLLSVTFFTPIAYAKDNQEPVNVLLPKGEIINKDYFAAGDTVTLTGVVNGDAYVAGGMVIVDGTVNGDLFVAGGNVEIRGPIKNDLRAAGGTVTIASTIGGNVTVGAGTVSMETTARIGGSILAGSGNLNLFAPVGKGITAGVGNLIINNTVGGDIVAGVGQLVLQPKTKIGGDLFYWSEEKATIANAVTVTGDVVYHNMPKQEAKPTRIAKEGVLGLIGALAGTAALMAGVGVIAQFIVGLALMALLPSFTEKTITLMHKNPWGSFGLGIVTVMVLPILAVTAMATVIGIPIGMFLFMALGLLCLIGHIYAALFLGRGVFTGLKTDVHRAWQLLVGLIILGIFTLIPILGWLARAIFVLIGTGAILFEKHAVYRQMRARHLV